MRPAARFTIAQPKRPPEHCGIQTAPGRGFALVSSISAIVVVLAAACGGMSGLVSLESMTSPSLELGPVQFGDLSNPSPPPPLGNGDLKFERLSVEHGLAQSTVNCILQDSTGFMWFGTDDGLNRFDGYSFVVYRHDPQNSQSPSHNTITSLLQPTFRTLKSDIVAIFDRGTE
jgi:hypothetical protein